MTFFHALVDRAAIRAGEWVVIYGCGGIGLSAINIAAALGCRVIGVDIQPGNLALARKMGAHHVIDSRQAPAVDAVKEITQGGAHVAVDALGIAETCINSVRSLRKGGRHVQVGVTTKKEAGYVNLPVDEIVMRELQFIGSLGMPAHQYEMMIPMVAQKQLKPGAMVTREIALSEVSSVFEEMSKFATTGTFVVTQFH